MRLYTPGEAKILTIDMRRTLMGAVPKEYQLGYLTNHAEAMKKMRELAGYLLPQAADIGLHVIITRRMGGASRAAYEKVLQMMNDLAVTGILLSGNPSEGAIINGVKPKRAVPGRAQVVHRELGVVAAQLVNTPPASI